MQITCSGDAVDVNEPSDASLQELFDVSPRRQLGGSPCASKGMGQAASSRAGRIALNLLVIGQAQ